MRPVTNKRQAYRGSPYGLFQEFHEKTSGSEQPVDLDATYDDIVWVGYNADGSQAWEKKYSTGDLTTEGADNNKLSGSLTKEETKELNSEYHRYELYFVAGNDPLYYEKGRLWMEDAFDEVRNIDEQAKVVIDNTTDQVTLEDTNIYVALALQAKNDTEQLKSDVETLKQDTQDIANQAQTDITNAKNSALSEISSSQTDAITAIEQAETDGITAVDNARDQGITAIQTERDSAISTIQGLVDETKGYRDQTQTLKNSVDQSETNVSQDANQVSSDKDTVEQLKADVEALKNTVQTLRNETETFRNETEQEVQERIISAHNYYSKVISNLQADINDLQNA